jgi:hypothetical protein
VLREAESRALAHEKRDEFLNKLSDAEREELKHLIKNATQR